MFEVAVLCRRVPGSCQALLPTGYLLSTAAYQLSSNAMSLTLPLIADWGAMRHLLSCKSFKNYWNLAPVKDFIKPSAIMSLVDI